MTVEIGSSAPAMTVTTLLDRVRAERAAPGGGSVACVTVALAAALLEMGARQSGADFDEADGAVAQAAALRRGALRLAAEDAEVFDTADATLRSPSGDDQEARDAAIGLALDRAAAVPVAISDLASDVVELGAIVMTLTRDDRRADVATGVLLAEAACLAAGHLVEVNLTTMAGDERLVHAQHAARRAGKARERGLKRAAWTYRDELRFPDPVVTCPRAGWPDRCPVP